MPTVGADWLFRDFDGELRFSLSAAYSMNSALSFAYDLAILTSRSLSASAVLKVSYSSRILHER